MICLENAAISPHLSPPLTTIRQPLDAMAEKAVQITVEQATRPPSRRIHAILKSRLIERGSVAFRAT